MESDLSRIIDTLTIRLIGIQHIKILQPVTLLEDRSLKNRLLIVHKGQVTVTPQDQKYETVLSNNDLYFIPAGCSLNITYGTGDHIVAYKKKLDNKTLTTYLEPCTLIHTTLHSDLLSVIELDVQAYNAIDFFHFVEISSFKIEPTNQIQNLIKYILEENQYRKLGKVSLLNSTIVIFIVLLIRYMINKQLFVDSMNFKLNALMDARLVKLFTYINSLPKDLSNDTLAKHVNLNKAYVGQFFRKHTKMNLQEYIRSIRLQHAINLLSTTSKPISTVCAQIGFKDFAYFCRLFKKKVGYTAMQVRKKTKMAI